ncbi:hypothetical protein B1A75_17050 [Geobacillus sp. LEMMY01]|nr:hypothetical protein B1A75_17050 [Geobacillus sp. LEMMY01]
MILEWREEQHLYIRLLRLRSDMIEPHFLLNHEHSRRLVKNNRFARFVRNRKEGSYGVARFFNLRNTVGEQPFLLNHQPSRFFMMRIVYIT